MILNRLAIHMPSPSQVSLRNVVSNACKQYTRSRPPPSSESVKRSKEMAHADVSVHPILGMQAFRLISSAWFPQIVVLGSTILPPFDPSVLL